MKHKIKKWPAILAGSIALAVAVFIFVHYSLSAISHTGFLILGGWFLLGACFFYWSAFQRKYPELVIEDDIVWIRGSQFPREQISHFKIAPITGLGGYGVYAIIKFHKMPDLPLGWRLYKVLERLNFSMPLAPKMDNLGIPLPSEPRLIIGMNWFADDYQDINRRFLESEQASSGQPATRPESKSEGDDKPQPEAEGRSR